MSIKFFALHDLRRDVARHSRCSTAPSAVYHPSGWGGGNLREKAGKRCQPTNPEKLGDSAWPHSEPEAAVDFPPSLRGR